MPISSRESLDAALAYFHEGWNVVPIAVGGKKPPRGCSWKRWTEERQTRADVLEMFTRFPNSDVGVITGAVSNLVVVDVDGPEAESALENVGISVEHPVRVRTSRGWHLYFKHPGGTVRTRTGVLPGVDVRADGGLVVVPPSMHASGIRYEWRVGDGDAMPTPPICPSFVASACGSSSCIASDSPILERVQAGIREGERNDALAALAGSLLGDGLAFDDVLAECTRLNQRHFVPPLSAREVKATVASIAKRDAQRTRNSGGALVARRFDTIESAPIEWLWPSYVPLGMLTLVDGEPGLGKSNLTLDLAARVTTGTPMPDGSPCPQGGVILFAPEDSPESVIRPRLIAMGADLSRVAIIDGIADAAGVRPFALPGDIAELRNCVDAVGARLIVFDPLMAHITTRVNTWNDQESRAALMPLVQLANEKKVAVLGIRHLTKKTDTTAINAGSGSIGFAATARAVFLTGRHPEDDDSRVIALAKGNLAPEPPSWAYRLVDSDGAPRVEWNGTTPYSAAALLAAQREAAPLKAEGCVYFVTLALSEGPLRSSELEERAAAAGYSKRTLERACKTLNTIASKVGFGEHGYWIVSLPSAKTATSNP